MCFVASDFLHDVQEIYGREEIPKREHSDGFFGWRRCGVSQFVHFRSVITLRRVRDGFLCRCSGGVFRSWLWSWSVSSNGRRNRVILAGYRLIVGVGGRLWQGMV